MSAPLALDLEGPVTDGFRSVMTFIPRLLGFLVILLLGYVLAKLVAKLVDKGLEKAGFDRAVERGGIRRALSSTGYDASDVVAALVFFAVFVPFLSAAVATLGIDALTAPLAAFIALIPAIIVAVVLVVLGAVVASTVRTVVANVLSALSYGGALATAAAALVLFGFVKAALDQVGIATVVTTALLYTVLATVAGVVVVGVGGGLVKPMQARWESMLAKADRDKDKVKAQSSTSGAEVYPTAPSSAPTAAMPTAAVPTTTMPTGPSVPTAPTTAYGRPRP